MKQQLLILFSLLASLSLRGQSISEKTTFKFGGYIKADFINTLYENGDVDATSPLRDFHLPSQIPVGASDENFDLDYHIKESRFNFDVVTTLMNKEIHGFIELDFLLSQAGDEKISNSFNPRVRHAFFEWDRLLIGQTWSTFMVVTIPDEIDFSGAMEGLVFVRQPQIRYTAGTWMFSVENPETTITTFKGTSSDVTDSEISPDVVARKNFSRDWGNWSIAGIGRTLHKRDSVNRSALGYGITTGGKLKVGKKGDDLRIMATYGSGLGRYIAAAFISSSVQDEKGDLNPIQTFNGYIAYNHYWVPEKWSSSISISAIQSFHDEQLIGDETNSSAFSASGNVKWDPIPQIRCGVEYMYGYRELENESNGAFHRIQFAAKYFFGYKNTSVYEKD